MCGIAGFWGKQHPTDFYTPILQNMTSAMDHRGPDSKGVWADPAAGLGFAHARLAILDLSPSGAQPMESSDHRYVITYNGEVYNHLSIRRNLESIGQAPAGGWRGHSDTETLLAAISAFGLEKALSKTIGMFAFALWDRTKRTLSLVRDRLGIKPLYYGFSGKTLLFASHPAPLKSHPNWTGQINRGALALYFRHLYVPEPYCIYEGLGKMPPGTFIRFTQDDLTAHTLPEPQAYWSLQDVAERGLSKPFTGTLAEATAALEKLLIDAVSVRMLADVPLGAFLSGGIDSTAVAAAMQFSSPLPTRTFSIGFNEQGYDEAAHARQVAKHLGTEHTELYISSSETQKVIPLLPTIYDEPFADVSQIPTHLVSKLARESVTVALSGDGGDEMFGGYSRHFIAPRLWDSVKNIPAPIRRAAGYFLTGASGRAISSFYEHFHPKLPTSKQQTIFRDKLLKLAHALPARSAAEFHRALVSYWNGSSPVNLAGPPLPTLFDSGLRANAEDDFTRWMILADTLSYLPGDILTKVDRASMAVSLEVRVPMLDHRICEFAHTLPTALKVNGGRGKLPLRLLLSKILPKDLLERPKQGFSVPIDVWLKGPLREWAEELLSENSLEAGGLLHARPIRQKWQEHLAGKNNWQYHLWAVLMFRSWHQNSA